MNAIRWLSHSPKNRSLAQVNDVNSGQASVGVCILMVGALAALSWSVIIIAIRSLI